MIASARPTMTAEEFERYAASHGPCELIRGEVRPLTPASYHHGSITGRLHYFISRHVYGNDLGAVTAAETGFRLDDDGKPTVRAPDIAFVAKHREPPADFRGFAPMAPDLAVETISPNDGASEVTEKIGWWLAHGVRLVWVLDPENKLLTAYHPDGSARVLQQHDTLGGGDVLPGFSLSLAELFA